MKKYHQLILLIITVVSISLFLMYRHEYNRLHYVLEVFNFFGQPCNLTDLQNDDLIEKDWGPVPIWQEVDEGYVYSAFLIGMTKVKAIALQNKAEKFPRTCYIWYEGNRTATVGKFEWSRINKSYISVNLVPYFYYCIFTNLDYTPFAVSFSSKVLGKNDIPKTMITNNFISKSSDKIIACVAPSFFNKNMFIEFISFHKMIGINTFLFYDGNIPYRLSNLIKSLSQRLEMNIIFLPWNYPKTDNSLSRMLVENDCLLRAQRHTKYVVTLHLNEYVIPPQFSSLIDSVKLSENYKLRIPMKSFCINNSEVNQPIALQNYEFINDHAYNQVVNMFNIDDVKDNIGGISEGISIHKYIACSDQNFETKTDYNMKRYATDFIRTTLVQLLINGQI